MMLIEGLVAILIFSFGILAIVGLLASTTRFSTDAKYRADASFLANQSIGTMWTDRNNLSSYAITNQAVTSLPSGTRTIAVAGNQVTVTITWQMPGEAAGHTYSVIALING
jgi:type IV pilus assembly protein PilV